MTKYILASAILSTTVLFSCGGGEEKKEPEQKVDSTVVEEQVDTAKGDLNEIAEFKFHVFLANVPSPLESMILLPKSGVSINKDWVNKIENADMYSTLSKKALNYGIYGVDLGYLTAYDQTQEVTDYFATLKSLAEGLGATDQFNKVLSDRFQANIDNKDSLLILMDKAIGATEDYLKNNQKLEAATLMLTGSWIETSHLLAKSIADAKDADVTALKEKLFEQKNSLISIIDVLKEQGTKDCKKLIGELDGVHKVFEKLTGVEGITAEFLKELSAAGKVLRDKTIAK